MALRPFILPFTKARRNLLLHLQRFGSEASSARSRLVYTTHQLSSQNVETRPQLRSRIAQRLNVPDNVRLALSFAAALLENRF